MSFFSGAPASRRSAGVVQPGHAATTQANHLGLVVTHGAFGLLDNRLHGPQRVGQQRRQAELVCQGLPGPGGLPAGRVDQGGTMEVWLRSLGGGVFAALRGGLVAAITQDWLQVGVAV